MEYIHTWNSVCQCECHFPLAVLLKLMVYDTQWMESTGPHYCLTLLYSWLSLNAHTVYKGSERVLKEVSYRELHPLYHLQTPECMTRLLAQWSWCTPATGELWPLWKNMVSVWCPGTNLPQLTRGACKHIIFLIFLFI